MPTTTPLLDAVTTLVDAVGSVQLPLPIGTRHEADAVRQRLIDQARDHLLPRLADRDAPLLVVVGGSTGAGKSTLVNTLVNERISQAGVLRPTTRSPVLVHHPDDAEWFITDRILPSLRRVHGRQGVDPDVLTLVANVDVPQGLAVLDAPDIDSVSSANRTLSRQLLSAADLWLFATTPSRYADAVPWELLGTAAARGTEIAVILGRVEPDQRAPVSEHLREMLDDGGLDTAEILVVEAVPPVDDLLPEEAVLGVARYLALLAGDAGRRREVADRTLRGGLASLAPRVAVVHAAVIEQLAAADDLRGRAADAHDHAIASILHAIDDGRVLRGEVLARWNDFVGGGDLVRRLEEGVGRLRDRVSALFRGNTHPEDELTDALGDGLMAVVADALERAHDDTTRSWRAGVGAGLLGGTGRRTTTGEIREQVQRWQDDVVDLVHEQAADKRSSARLVALGLNGVAAALMVAVFASTGGLTGAEVGVAGGTSVVAQRLLEAILGDQAVRSLTSQARDSLVARVRNVVEGQMGRFLAPLDELGLEGDVPARLDRAVAAVQRARQEAGL